jgi:putative transposase
MSNYRRFKTSGGTYFFTVVTCNRQEILCKPQSRNALRDAIEAVRASLPFRIDAWVLLPDHLRCIWTLPEGDADFSKRWGTIKTSFTKKVGWALPTNKKYSISRIRHRDANIWQRRFWEHQIRIGWRSKEMGVQHDSPLYPERVILQALG